MIDATVAAEQQREYTRLLRTPIADCLERFGWVRIRRGVWTLDAHRRRWTLDETAGTLVVKHRQSGGWGRPIELPYPKNAADLARAPL